YMLPPVALAVPLYMVLSYLGLLNNVSQVLSSINWKLDRLLLPRFTGLSTLGAFSVADNIAGLPYQTFVGPLLRQLMV
ncbi:hypothetical protein ACCS66_39025, partial [Rhizobium ruizarguesonis]